MDFSRRFKAPDLLVALGHVGPQATDLLHGLSGLLPVVKLRLFADFQRPLGGFGPFLLLFGADTNVHYLLEVVANFPLVVLALLFQLFDLLAKALDLGIGLGVGVGFQGGKALVEQFAEPRSQISDHLVRNGGIGHHDVPHTRGHAGCQWFGFVRAGLRRLALGDGPVGSLKLVLAPLVLFGELIDSRLGHFKLRLKVSNLGFGLGGAFRWKGVAELFSRLQERGGQIADALLYALHGWCWCWGSHCCLCAYDLWCSVDSVSGVDGADVTRLC